MTLKRRTLILIACALALYAWTRDRDRDDRKPGRDSAWRLWYRDTFDRDAPPSKEAEGVGIVSGLAALWEKTIREGLFDDGDASYSFFQLEWGPTVAHHASVRVDPFDNTGLAKIRRWFDAALRGRLAEAHARLLDDSARWDEDLIDPSEESLAIIEAADAAVDRDDLLRRLDAL